MVDLKARRLNSANDHLPMIFIMMMPSGYKSQFVYHDNRIQIAGAKLYGSEKKGNMLF